MDDLRYLSHGDMFSVVTVPSTQGGWNIYLKRGQKLDLICADITINQVDANTRIIDPESKQRLIEAIEQKWRKTFPINVETIIRQLYAQTKDLK